MAPGRVLSLHAGNKRRATQTSLRASVWSQSSSRRRPKLSCRPNTGNETKKKTTLRSQNKRGQFNSGTVVFPPTFCSVNYRNSQSDTIRAAEGDGSAVKMSGQTQNKLPQNKLIFAPGGMTTERNGSCSFIIFFLNASALNESLGYTAKNLSIFGFCKAVAGKPPASCLLQ